MNLLQAQRNGLKSQLSALEAPLEKAYQNHDTAQGKGERHAWCVTCPNERFVGQQERLHKRVARTAAKLERLRGQQAALLEQVEAVTKRMAELTAENQALPTAVRIIIRRDAGFSTDANLAWLIAMGYTVLIKVHSGHTTTRLQRTVDPEATWNTVLPLFTVREIAPQEVT